MIGSGIGLNPIGGISLSDNFSFQTICINGKTNKEISIFGKIIPEINIQGFMIQEITVKGVLSKC